MPKGIKGFQKGHPQFNKGKSLKGADHPNFGKRGKDTTAFGSRWQYSEETKRKMKVSQNLPELKEKQRQRMLGKNNPQFGLIGSKSPNYKKPCLESTRIKISNANRDKKHLPTSFAY